MRKITKILLITILITAIICVSGIAKITAVAAGAPAITDNLNSSIVESKIGIGGGGALFEPAISPHDSKELLVVPDMGGLYLSHDQGGQWLRSNLDGTVMHACYDPNRAGVIYAGGSGLWRSTDNGNTFTMIFPKAEDMIAKRIHRGNSLQSLFTYSKVYDMYKQVLYILIDPDNSDHIFVLMYYNKEGKVYESIDNGENFTEIFTYSKNNRNSSPQFDFNELVYKKETNEILSINGENIVSYNLNTKTKSTVYESPTEMIDVASVYEGGKTYFVLIEKVTGRADTDTVVYYTDDFVNKVDFTSAITAVKPTYFNHKTYGDVTYKYNFNYVAATSLNNIYVTNKSDMQTSSIKPYPYTIDGIIHYKNGSAEYLYGNPFHDHNYLSSRSWNDGCTYALGIAVSKNNEDEFIFTTLNGIYYSADGVHIYPKHITLVAGTYPNATFTTNGIDEQRTYAVLEDPFNDGVLLLLNTDLGLIRSEDNGESWSWIRSGIPSSWTNTIYDAEFDQRNPGVVYSLWSGKHNAPMNPGNMTDNVHGGFAISRDGGKTWDATYSSGLPENVVPVKMSVIYEENNSEAIIYVATFNCGFYVSHDSGKTFVEMNDGIARINYKAGPEYQYIYAQDIEVKDGRIFGLTKKCGDTADKYGKLFEYISGTWQEIALPARAYNPTDVYYNDGVLYISGMCEPVWDGKNGTSFNNYGGGVFTYKDGNFEQIFDESIYTTSVVIDKKGTIYIADIEGNIYRKEKYMGYERIYEKYHYVCESMQITDDGDRIYLSTNGGGMLRLTNLNSLYDHEHSGGTATCNKKAICNRCKEEYGDLLPHTYDAGKVTKASTYDTEGEKTYTCVDCGSTKIEKLAKLPKDVPDRVDNPDTGK